MEPPPVNDVVSNINTVHYDAPALAVVINMFKEISCEMDLGKVLEKELSPDGTLTVLLDINSIYPFNILHSRFYGVASDASGVQRAMLHCLPNWVDALNRGTVDFALACYSTFMNGIAKYYDLGIRVEYLIGEASVPLRLVCEDQPCLIQMKLGENRPEFKLPEDIPEKCDKYLYAVYDYLAHLYQGLYHEDRIKIFRYIHELTFDDVYSIQWSKEDVSDSTGCIRNFEISG